MIQPNLSYVFFLFLPLVMFFFPPLRFVFKLQEVLETILDWTQDSVGETFPSADFKECYHCEDELRAAKLTSSSCLLILNNSPPEEN